AAIDVVDAKHVGQEDPVEPAPFQGAGKAGPVIQIGIVRRAVARMRPQARRLVPDAVHLERVEADLLHPSTIHPPSLATTSDAPVRGIVRRGAKASCRYRISPWSSLIRRCPIILNVPGGQVTGENGV